jgi:hypothetical protein
MKVLMRNTCFDQDVSHFNFIIRSDIVNCFSMYDEVSDHNSGKGHWTSVLNSEDTGFTQAETFVREVASSK